MARIRKEVTFRKPDPKQVPDVLVESALVVSNLEGRGVVEEVAKRLRIRRQGGFPGVDVFLVLLIYLVASVKEGLRPFWGTLGPHACQLAALAGRKRLPSPAAVSRALGVVEVASVREVALWLLTEAPEVDTVLTHAASLTWDAQGEPWQVFDYDPTVTTLRHRALPVDEDLPEPKRRSEETGAPGHSGRKRGDLQFRRADVQHAGSGVWTHAHLHTGNGDGVADLALALESVAGLVTRLDHPLGRTLVRMDGEHGSVPFFTTCREAGLPFLTRLNRPALYEDPQILERLRTATWYVVPDSGSGPRRAATDLGVLTVSPDSKTRRPDGSRYEPVQVRVVVSAFPKDGNAQRGKVLDGWQVELFAADLPADAWPAPEVIASYYGRSGQENRFAQEDREVGLDRIFSYHLPGQELATLVGLFALNLRIARGFELEPPPAVEPVPRLRRAQVDERISPEWPRDPSVLALLHGLDWTHLLAGKPGWTWDSEAGELRCPEGRTLTLTSVRPGPHAEGKTGIIFRRPTGGCEDCATRGDCLCSQRPAAAKHLELSVPTEVADALRKRLARVRGKTAPAAPKELRPIDVVPGLRAVLPPLFLPAEARHRFRETFRGATLTVEVEFPPPEPPRPRLVAADEADRQHRRLTWQERLARNALPDQARVRMDVSGSPDLRLLLQTPRDAKVAVGERL
jgi:hypothetical protein